MDLRAYIRIFRRWLWLIILLALIAAGINFIVSRIQAPQYQAAVTIQVGSAQYLQNPNTGLIQTSEQLADTYAVIVKKYPVLEATTNKLQLKIQPTALLSYFQVRVVPNTALLEITVTYPDPVIAADMANALGDELIANSPTVLALDQQAQIKTLQSEIANAQNVLDIARKDLSDTNDKISKIQGTVPPELTTHDNDLVTQINAAQANFAQLSSTLANLQKEGSTNSLTFVEHARIPDKATGLPIVASSLIAALAGAAVAFGLAFLIEYLNDTIRNPAELSSQIGVNLLGSIAPFGKRNTYNGKLITWLQPRSPISEAYRALRVNLMYMEKDKDTHHRVYVVTSPSPAEGKTVTAANLAVTFSMTGMHVLLIDADMRRPNQHSMFGLNNLVGLSNALSSTGPLMPGVAATSKRSADKALSNGNQAHDSANDEEIKSRMALLTSALIQKTEIPGLDVVTSGLPPANPAELLGAIQMQEFVHHLSENEDYDVVIFDTPPVLSVSDSHILASVAHANVLLVVEAGKTRRGAAARAIQQMAALSIPLVGMIVNRLNPRDVDTSYGAYYGYYGYGYSNSSTPQEDRQTIRPVPIISRDANEKP